jgi:tight adherence protein C
MSTLIWAIALAVGAHLLANYVFAWSRPSLLARLSLQSRHASFWQTEVESWKQRLSRRFEARARGRRALYELPELLEMIAVALSAGDSLFAALARVSFRAEGVLARELQKVFLALELGADLETEMNALARRLPQRQVVEFASKVNLGISRGSPLVEMIREQARTARAEIRNDFLRQAGRNETRMLIPLVFLILPVTVLFAIYPSLQLLNVSYL